GAAGLLSLLLRIDRDVIDPAAVTVVPHHGGRDDRMICVPDEDRRVVTAPDERNVTGGIVPRACQAAALPQRYDGVDIAVGDRRDREFAHRTLPGFKIPFGSSVRLSARISSIATGSFTLGNRSRFITPMPCSAEIEPPYFSTTSNTTLFTSCQRSRNAALSASTGCATL